MYNPYENVIKVIDKTADVLRLEKSSIDKIKYPERELTCSLPLEMDDGSIRVFKGYRVQHSSNLGPCKGGIRFHKNVTLDLIKALSFWMSLKCAVVNLPLGGGKGGIAVDPKELTQNELDNLTHLYGKMIAPIIGPYMDIPAPDVNTNSHTMAIIEEEYESYIGKPCKAVITGKSITDGGSLGRDEATGRGILYTTNYFASKFNLDKKACKVAIQGFGNVGYFSSKLLMEEGYKIVAISNSKGAIYNEKGIDVNDLYEYTKTSKDLSKYGKGSIAITNDKLLECECDILIPAALEDQITKLNAKYIKAKMIVEGANGPTTEEADNILFERNITVVPDILANSGGVIVSYFEYLQNLKDEGWSLEEVRTKLFDIINKASVDVYNKSKELNLPLRIASYAISLERLLK